MGLLALDDRDATIVYSTGWGQAGSANEFNSTTTFTNTVGATAKVTFYGTKITVFGTIAGSLVRKPTSTYQIDSGTTTTFEGDPGLTTKFNQAFFESPTLPAGEHTLTITNTGDDASLFLDLLMVTPLDTPMVTTVTTTATPPAVTSARTVTVTQSAQGAGSPSGTAAGSVDSAATGGSQRSSNTGAIVGGIIEAAADEANTAAVVEL
ncbi:hypothetical protein NMY22_g17474 [Coprinellus aureogranulatus]|nr:hypothetical protein NMY22_g17474 [Coprinellus aureogranulatus]